MKKSRWLVTPLAGLGKALSEKSRSLPVHHPREKQKAPNPHKESDAAAAELFQQAMSDVREIAEFRELPVHVLKKDCPVNRECSGRQVMEELRSLVNGKRRITLSDTDEYVEWVRKGIHTGVVQKLRSGEVSVQDTLDLHGYTVSEAEEELRSFMGEAKRKGLCCVKVIHGRGLRSPRGPVLKEAVLRRLKPFSLAYATARHMDGGLGATYVLLRR